MGLNVYTCVCGCVVFANGKISDEIIYEGIFTQGMMLLRKILARNKTITKETITEILKGFNTESFSMDGVAIFLTKMGILYVFKVYVCLEHILCEM